MDASITQEHKPRSEQNGNEGEENVYQDVLSQFTLLNGFTNIVLGSALSSNTSQDEVVAALRNGVDKLIAQIPWLGGQVEHTPGPPGHSGVYTPAPWPTEGEPNDLVQVKDCADSVPSIE